MYPAVSLAQARAARDAARADLAVGIDPGEALREAKRIKREGQKQTFAKVAEAFMAFEMSRPRATMKPPSACAPKSGRCFAMPWPMVSPTPTRLMRCATP